MLVKGATEDRFNIKIPYKYRISIKMQSVCLERRPLYWNRAQMTTVPLFRKITQAFQTDFQEIGKQYCFTRLVLTRDDFSVSSIFTDYSVKSDHNAVLFTISCASPGVVKKSITYQTWKSIDVSSVQADISDAFEDFAYQIIDTAVRSYNTTLADIINNHAQQKSRIVTVRADKPWYTAELSQEKRLRR